MHICKALFFPWPTLMNRSNKMLNSICLLDTPLTPKVFIAWGLGDHNEMTFVSSEMAFYSPLTRQVTMTRTALAILKWLSDEARWSLVWCVYLLQQMKSNWGSSNNMRDFLQLKKPVLLFYYNKWKLSCWEREREWTQKAASFTGQVGVMWKRFTSISLLPKHKLSITHNMILWRTRNTRETSQLPQLRGWRVK